MAPETSGWRNARILVTGGAGFIGSALVWELNRRGCGDVVIADVTPASARSKNLSPLAYTEYVDAAGLLERLVSGSLGKFEYAFHLGACSSTTETDAGYLYRNNFEFSRDLAAWAIRANVRFVYASSAATYGDGSAGMSDAHPESLERLQPLNLYGQSKHLMDLHAWRTGWFDKIVALKYFNVFGPNEDHKGDMRSVVHKSVAQVMETGVIRLFKSYRPEYADGEQRRDFLYVKDAVNMTLHLGANDSASGIFNIGSGVTRTWNELAHAVFPALGRKPRIEYIDMPEAIRDKYQYFTQAEIGKLLATGYETPITTLENAVTDYVLNYLLPGRSLGSENVSP
jgi:ADP-L-glycero-D-manno-heptose 6-epimerase